MTQATWHRCLLCGEIKRDRDGGTLHTFTCSTCHPRQRPFITSWAIWRPFLAINRYQVAVYVLWLLLVGLCLLNVAAGVVFVWLWR
jgi:hypothetical protein